MFHSKNLSLNVKRDMTGQNRKMKQVQLDLVNKREVFGPTIITPEVVKPVGYKWVFVRKQNEKNKVMRYKTHLIAQGFSQRPGIDYE